MAGAAEWVEGARLRTLPAAISPVLVGSGVAAFHDGFVLAHAALALLVALALQVGVNFANDYSDGIRGTDAVRVGPLRLVGSGAASPRAVKTAAFACFGLAGLAGLLLVVLTQAWWLLVLGAACIVAAWFYTGGSRPYGYAGWGEAFVFVFFGLVATVGTTYVQLGATPEASWWGGVLCGAVASAILVANNLRDRAGDAAAGKHTLAVRLGDRWTRWLYVALVGLGLFAIVQVAVVTSWWALLGAAMVVLLGGPVRLVLAGAEGPALIQVLKLTGIAELVAAVGVVVGLVVAGVGIV